jgi:carbamoyl-phosphate synthase large subunit
MSRFVVMVTGVGGGGHGEQIVKALRLAPTAYTIVGGDMTPVSTGFARVDHPCILPPARDPQYIDAVLAVCRRRGVRALFHGSEAELKVMSRERDRIEAAGIFLPINPAEVIDTCMDKARTVAFLQAHGFGVPRTVTIRSGADLADVPFLPAVLKPSVGGGGSAGVLLAQTREELQAFGGFLLESYPEFIVQEYVGRPEDEYTVGVLLSMDGELINSIAVRRYILSSLSNRIKVPNRGDPALGPILAISSGVSQGDVGRFPEVTRQCEEMALALGCRGAVNIQCRFVDGRVVVFEINPRFSGTTSLRAMVDYNEPDVLIRRHCLGERIEAGFPYREGVILRGLEETLIADHDFERAVDYL